LTDELCAFNLAAVSTGARSEALAGAPQPVHTFLNINQLAWPGMLVEVDVIAITKEP
jgi:hypothetical protein